VERVVRANLHALAATDTTGKEIRFLQSTWRTNTAIIFFSGKGRTGAQQRKNRDAGRKAGEDFAALQAGSFAGIPLGKEFKLEAVMRALADAIQTKYTFGFAPGHAANGVIAALTVQEATIAVIAGCRVLLESQDGPARDETEECAQRTNGPAKEAGDSVVEGQDKNEKGAEQKSLAKMGLFEAENRKIHQRMHDSGDDPHE